MTMMPALSWTAEGLSYGERPRPLPAPSEVVLRVLCAGLCRTDLYAASGAVKVAPGRVLGHEFSGLIVSLGEGVRRDLVGVRVAVFPWVGCGECEDCCYGDERLQTRCPRRQFLGVDRDGAFASEIAVPADRCFPIPDSLDDRAAAYAEPVAAALGVGNLGLPRGTRVGVFGVNRLGSLTTRLLDELGCVPVTSPEPNSLEWAVESSSDPGVLESAMHALRCGGTLVAKSRPPGAVPWPLRLQVERELRVVAPGYGSFVEAIDMLARRPQLFADLWEEPRPLGEWPEVFAGALAGAESRKAFFVPPSVA